VKFSAVTYASKYRQVSESLPPTSYPLPNSLAASSIHVTNPQNQRFSWIDTSTTKTKLILHVIP